MAQENKKSIKGVASLLEFDELMVQLRHLESKAGHMEGNYGCGFAHTSDRKQRD